MVLTSALCGEVSYHTLFQIHSGGNGDDLNMATKEEKKHTPSTLYNSHNQTHYLLVEASAPHVCMRRLTVMKSCHKEFTAYEAVSSKTSDVSDGNTFY